MNVPSRVLGFFSVIIGGGGLLFSGMALAEEPVLEQDGLGIELEELLSERGSLRAEFGVTFGTVRSAGVAGFYQTIQTGTGEFVTVPVGVGQEDRQSEVAIGTYGLRYGLTDQTELYARTTVRYNHSQFINRLSGAVEKLSHASLQSLVFGLNHRFVEEGEFPGVVGFADVSALENVAAQETRFASGTSGTAGFTAYRVLDPVVLSLTAGYKFNLERRVGADRIDPGDTFFFNPSIGFAVNNELTLTGGFGLNFTGAEKVNGVSGGARATNADLQFGLAYAWDKETTLRADARAEVLGDRGFTAGMTLTRKFGLR
ncbi:hypothetical protein ACLB6G_16450 [Zhengella sp. ZM62]|uniref:hypothetical protein n=1 Tax=Zhengella sedimenti TaxID=3390035 RepID=UPI0039757013